MLENIEQEFRAKIGAQVKLDTEGLDRFRVLTPFMFDDGDHLVIILKRERNSWILSDEGHTYMHITYDLDEKVFQKGNRQKIISNALNAFSVEDRSGELRLRIPDERYGDAFFNFVQALLKIIDVTFLSRERIISTFLEDWRELIGEKISPERRVFDYYDKQHDPDAKYIIDCKVNGMKHPLFLFAIQNDDKCRDATITLLQHEKWGTAFHSMAIFEDQEDINRKVLARFGDVCERLFSSLATNRDRIASYLNKATAEL